MKLDKRHKRNLSGKCWLWNPNKVSLRLLAVIKRPV